MASELLNWTAQIVISHASVTELTPQELLQEIKEVHEALTSLAGEAAVSEAETPVSRKRKPRAKRVLKAVKMAESPETKEVVDAEKAPFEDQDYVEFMADREG